MLITILHHHHRPLKSLYLLSFHFTSSTNNNKLFGYPFRIPKSQGHQSITQSFQFFDLKVNQQDLRANKFTQQPIRSQYLPFIAATIKNVQTRYKGQYGITSYETYTTMRKDASGVMRPVQETRSYTLWYPCEGVLQPVDYGFEKEPQLRVYADFRLPRKLAEGVVRGMPMDAEPPRELTEEEVKTVDQQHHEVLQHTMKQKLVKQLIITRLQRLEQQRAKSHIRSCYIICTDARIRHLQILQPSLHYELVKFHLPVYIAQYCKDPAMFKIVNGFTGELKGHSLLHAGKVSLGLSTVVLLLTQVMNGVTTDAAGVAVAAALAVGWGGTTFYNYLKKNQMDEIGKEMEKNREVQEEEEDKGRERDTQGKEGRQAKQQKKEQENKNEEKGIQRQLEDIKNNLFDKFTKGFNENRQEDLKQRQQSPDRNRDEHPTKPQPKQKSQHPSKTSPKQPPYQQHPQKHPRFTPQPIIPESHSPNPNKPQSEPDPADIILKDQDCKLFNLRMGKRYTKKELTEHYKAALAKYDPPEYTGHPAIAATMKRQLKSIYDYSLKRRGRDE